MGVANVGSSLKKVGAYGVAHMFSTVTQLFQINTVSIAALVAR